MIGLDTNVLVRYLLKDDPEQVIRVRSLMHSLTATNPGFISLVTLVETAWVLSRTCQFDRSRIAETISALLQHPGADA